MSDFTKKKKLLGHTQHVFFFLLKDFTYYSTQIENITFYFVYQGRKAIAVAPSTKVIITLSDWVFSCRILASMAAASKLLAAVIAWMSPVKCKLNYKIRKICDYTWGLDKSLQTLNWYFSLKVETITQKLNFK